MPLLLAGRRLVGAAIRIVLCEIVAPLIFEQIEIVNPLWRFWAVVRILVTRCPQRVERYENLAGIDHAHVRSPVPCPASINHSLTNSRSDF